MERCAMTIMVDDDVKWVEFHAPPGFVPLKYGKEITEEEFRTMVKGIHGLS
jgi:hypothetical protein